jgi:excisionase family DNA binding protein
MTKTELLLQQVLFQCRGIEIEVSKISDSLVLNKEILNIEEFCRYTGMSKATAYKLTGNSLIKHFKPTGSLIFFRKVDVDNFLLQNPVLPAEKISDIVTDHIIRKSSKKLIKRKS